MAIEQAAGEDRGHARVRIAERLAWPVDVEETQGQGRHVVGRADREAQLLMVALRDGIDAGRQQWLRLCCSLWLERIARSGFELPPTFG